MSPLDLMLSQYSGRPSYGSSAPAPVTSAPNSFFSAVPAPPDNVGAGGFSRGYSPFGQLVPNLSPAQAAEINSALSDVTYSAPLGGYITRAEANDPSSAYVRGYYGKPMTGGDPNANRIAAQAFDIMGSAPTRVLGTTALNQLPGYTPSAGPSFNQTLSPYGNASYGGPFAFPGWGNRGAYPATSFFNFGHG